MPARATPPGQGGNWPESHVDAIEAIRFQLLVGDEIGAESGCEDLVAHVGAARRPQVRRLCGFPREVLAPRTLRGWNARQRNDLDRIRTLHADGDKESALDLAARVAADRP